VSGEHVAPVPVQRTWTSRASASRRRTRLERSPTSPAAARHRPRPRSAAARRRARTRRDAGTPPPATACAPDDRRGPLASPTPRRRASRPAASSTAASVGFLGVPLVGSGGVARRPVLLGRARTHLGRTPTSRRSGSWPAPPSPSSSSAALSGEYQDTSTAGARDRRAGVGSFDWDLTSGELLWDDRLLTIFGYGPDEFGAPSPTSRRGCTRRPLARRAVLAARGGVLDLGDGLPRRPPRTARRAG
jgi:hypothetical protein